MKKLLSILTVKDYIFIGIIVVLLFLFLTKGCRKDPNVQVVQPTLQKTTQKTDKKGNAYTEVKGTLYTEAQMKSITDSIKKVLGKGKVQTVTQTVTRIDTMLKQDTLYVDNETGEIYVADSNKNVQLSYRGNYKTKTGNFHMVLTPDTATGITTIKKHLFKANELTLNQYHTNSLFIPSEGYVYTAKIPKVLGAIGPTLGAAYCSDGKLHGFAGVGITFNLIGIRSRK